MTLTELHEVIQTAMGWTNTHSHEFEIDGVSYGDPDPDWESEFADESKVKLYRVAHDGGRIRYAYDFGDGWEHDVLVEKVAGPEPDNDRPHRIAGVDDRLGRRTIDCADAGRRVRSHPASPSSETQRRDGLTARLVDCRLAGCDLPQIPIRVAEVP